MVQEIPLTAITIGERFRKHLGNITTLAASIAQHGLLHPIVVTTGYELVAGRRRLAAYAHLELTMIPAHVIDLDDPLGAEIDENMQRQDLVPSEKVAVCEALEEREKLRALARMKRGKKQAPSDNLSEGATGKTRDLLAEKVDWSAHTYERAKVVVEAAKTWHSPE